MPQGNSPFPNNELTVRIGLLRTLESGVLDLIECPQCHKHTVSVWFTRPQEDQYRTWFLCAECSFEMRVQNSERPEYFSADRVDERLEAYDADILGLRRLS